MDEWDRDTVYAEIERLGRAMHQLRPSYFDPLSQPTPGAERLVASGDAELTHADVIGAKVELAEQHGVGFTVVEDMARQAHQKAGLGYSMGEQAKVLNEVMLSLERGRDQLSDAQILELSRFGGQDDDTVGLASDLSIPDEAHLKAAAILARSKHGDWKDAGQLIEKRARELGVPDPLGSSGPLAASASTLQLAISMAGTGDYGGGEAVALAGLTQETSARRSREAGQDSADAVIARHPELAHLFKAGRTSSRKHPARSGKLIGTKSRAHRNDLDEDPQGTDQPARGGEVHRGVRAIIEDNPDLFTDGKGRDPSATAAWPVPGVKSPAQREREEQRARAGHQGDTRPLTDYARGSARTRYGR